MNKMNLFTLHRVPFTILASLVVLQILSFQAESTEGLFEGLKNVLHKKKNEKENDSQQIIVTKNHNEDSQAKKNLRCLKDGVNNVFDINYKPSDFCCSHLPWKLNINCKGSDSDNNSTTTTTTAPSTSSTSPLSSISTTTTPPTFLPSLNRTQTITQTQSQSQLQSSVHGQSQTQSQSQSQSQSNQVSNSGSTPFPVVSAPSVQSPKVGGVFSGPSMQSNGLTTGITG